MYNDHDSMEGVGVGERQCTSYPGFHAELKHLRTIVLTSFGQSVKILREEVILYVILDQEMTY